MHNYSPVKTVLIALLFIFIYTLNPGHSFCRGKKEKKEPGELRFWHSIGIGNKDILNSMVQSYNQTDPKMPVKPVFRGDEEELYLKLQSRETLPDIIQVPVYFLQNLQQKDYIIPLGSFISNQMLSDIPGKFWDSVSVLNHIMGIPFSYSLNLLYVNQHIVKTSGPTIKSRMVTWNDISSLTAGIKKTIGDKWGMFIPMETLIQFISFVESYSGKPLLKDQKLIVDTPEAVSAMEFLQQMVYQNTVMPAKITVNEGHQIFLAGNLGMLFAPSSILVYTRSHLPYTLDVWQLPAREETRPVVKGTCLGIVKSTSRREKESYRFIEYMVNYNNSIKWHTHTGNPPIRKSVRESLDVLIFYEENPGYLVPVAELNRGKIFNPRFDYASINKIIQKALEEIMLNRKPPAKVLSNAQKEINDYL
ncbi:MAG: extracellular solute-binding protein [Spirochaetota bacterium]